MLVKYVGPAADQWVPQGHPLTHVHLVNADPARGLGGAAVDVDDQVALELCARRPDEFVPGDTAAGELLAGYWADIAAYLAVDTPAAPVVEQPAVADEPAAVEVDPKPRTRRGATPATEEG